jgi:UDP-N-acetylglucosamine diphosphorylase/glucosamine-1-phosphate N-acetyltransferase
MSDVAIIVPASLSVPAVRALSPWSALSSRLAALGLTVTFAAPDDPCAARFVIDGRYPTLEADDVDLLLDGRWLVDGEGAVVAAPISPGVRPLALFSAPIAVGVAVTRVDARRVDGVAGLSAALAELRLRRAQSLLAAGALILAPERTWIDADVVVEPGAVIWPDVTLRVGTIVRAGAEVQPGCWLEKTEVMPGALVKAHSVCEGATIGVGCQVGPMAHLRPGAELAEGAKVGNFVEVKQARLGRGAKVSHLTYIGDAEVGAEANVGAGTITCNYDGYGKHRTVIGERAFIGSNSALVAPVTIGDGAIVGAGSVISKDVPADALAVERAPLKILDGFAPRLNEKNRVRAGK